MPISKLAFFDEATNKYVVDPGQYGLQVGSSSADSDVKLTASVGISGTISQRPTVVNAKPIQAGDTDKQIAQRVFFDINTTIDPQLTVSMNDESLYGYITKGQSKPLPAGLTFEYTSDRPNVVKVTGKTLHTVGSGVATITATAKYHGMAGAYVEGASGRRRTRAARPPDRPSGPAATPGPAKTSTPKAAARPSRCAMRSTMPG